jgi:tryptophan-rich hypothetical protein
LPGIRTHPEICTSLLPAAAWAWSSMLLQFARITIANTAFMNRFNPAKLSLSKWTAQEPRDRERHFIVTKLIRDADHQITHCVIEAVHSHREQLIDWQELRDADKWRQGWL